jgi:hypothetical protein
MSLIFEDSTPSIRSEADLFKVPSTDATIEKSSYIEFSPTTNVQENTGQIEFHIPASAHFYRDLRKSFLYIVLQVVKEDGSSLKREVIPVISYKVTTGSENVQEAPFVEPTDLVAPVNGLAHSLFSQCDVFMNDTLVSQANNLYPYRAVIENILNFGNDYKQCQASLALFYDEKIPEKFTTKNDDGFRRRYLAIKESSLVELIARPCIDIFNLDKYLLSGMDLKIKFTRTSNDFCLLQPTTNSTAYKIKIHSASLFVLSHQLLPSLRVAHEKILASGESAKYPLRRTELKQFVIPTGSKSIVRENLFYGQVPLRIVVGFVENSSLIGNKNKNPFCFKNFGCSYFSILVDEEQSSFKPLKFDFEKNISLLGFYTLLTSSGIAHQDLGININRDEYKSANKTLFAFSLVPEIDDDVFSVQKTGNVRFDIQFKTELTEPVSVVVYAEFNSLMEINKDRQVRID